jgi:hypothetical protein
MGLLELETPVLSRDPDVVAAYERVLSFSPTLRMIKPYASISPLAPPPSVHGGAASQVHRTRGGSGILAF